jgi:D-alanyl-D-alanine carboxypeptidase/D-alanyl-D-alanine-endopeptidase (penicillin-binding protein 4)
MGGAVCLFSLLLLSACGGKKSETTKTTQKAVNTIPVDTALQTRLKKFAAAPRCKGLFGFYVYDLTADKPVYGEGEKVTMSSASCLKLITGVAGLQLLGTDYTYPTSLWTTGAMKGDTLQGNVIFKAQLDPQLNEPDLKMFTHALKKKGIKKFNGKLVLDLVLHKPVTSEQHWYPWDLSFSRYGILYKGDQKVRKAVTTAFRQAGYQVADSQVVYGGLTRDARLLFRFRRPVDYVIKKMWKNSSNTQATSLLYTIGYHLNKRGNLPAVGVDYLRGFVRDSLGLKDKRIVIHDGCGLCTYNHLSAEVLVAVLRYGYQRPAIYKKLHTWLAISGVDGTLRAELSDPKLKGLVRGKTGTLSHPFGISSLAGYCKGADGHLLAFAIMDNDMSVLDARVLQKKLCLAMTDINHSKGRQGKTK